MRVEIQKSIASGVAIAPPSKSYAHRALICGALSKSSEIKNVALSKDIEATLNCLKAMGAEVNEITDGYKIGQLNLKEIPENVVLNCDESGSTLRFLIPLALTSGKKVKFVGSQKLFSRPLDFYENLCKEQGFVFEKNKSGITLCGNLKSGNYRIKGDVSSQFITGMLFALPLLDGFSIIEIIGDYESESYVDITIDMLSKYGIRITRMGNRYIIPGSQKFNSSSYTVEGDYSNTAFLHALTLLGGDVTVDGLNDNSVQGDKVYLDIYERLLRGERSFNLSNCPDLAPILFALAAVAGGALFRGTSRLRLKESDRGAAMAEELAKFGITLDVGDNTVRVHNGELTPPTEILNGHNDHRIVMALSVLSTLTGGIIDGAEAVSKSYPDFFRVLKNLNVAVTIYEDQ